MKKNLPKCHEYHRPDGMPFAAGAIKVYSHLSDTRRRTFTIEGLPTDWPKRQCPVCGGNKKRTRQVCRSCYDKIRRIMIPLTCSYCGVRFERIISDHDKMLRRGHTDVYCSFACSTRHHAVKNRRRCVACGKPCPKKSSKYCSKTCRASQRQKELQPKQCTICGETFEPKSRRTAYCSRHCANEAHSRRMRGKGNSHFKDGTSYASWFREMRPIVRERDGQACATCGRKDGKLIVHHVDHVPWHNEVMNLITLCETCHMVHHKSHKTPFPWLNRLAVARSLKLTGRQITKCIELEAKYFQGF
jgi:predicted nucleic acid-binding Zn ribbon protein